jgi:DNA polymerase III epsilon subunit-like protein
LEIAPQKKDRDQLTNGARVITPLPTTIRNENDNVFVPNTGALKAAPGEPNHIELTHTDRSFLSHQTNENESKLSHAIHKRQNVFFDYVDQYDDDSSRHVMPKGIFQRNNQKFLEAYDYGRAAKRHFLLSRISNLSVEEANQNRSDQKSHKEHEKLTDSFVLNTNNETILVFFDFETNGLDSSSSVLSFSALKVSVAEFDSYSWRILKTIDRYYFPEENYNPHAIKVNGLTEMKIKEKRGYVSTYPKNYKDDAEVELFFRDVDLIIAHNFDFDKKFLHPEARKIPSFCTMKSNIEFVGIYRRGGKTFKWPKLIETANAYGIAFDESKAHGSLYDTEICMEIFKNMLQMKKISISKQN